MCLFLGYNLNWTDTGQKLMTPSRATINTRCYLMEDRLKSSRILKSMGLQTLQYVISGVPDSTKPLILDLQVRVDAHHLNEVRSMYAPPEHSCFDLVPHAFAVKAEEFYSNVGRPVVTRDNVWDTYLALLAYFRALKPDNELEVALVAKSVIPAVGEDPDGDKHMDLLPYKRLREGDRVIGIDDEQVLEGPDNMGGEENSDVDVGELEPNEWTDSSSRGSSDDEF
jgi:hypothetical protein